ncbi:hypothetical protein C1T17_14535 [Sphingobium sp. SCG-1]|nr:hypothetical protein C1T17_14535 [Sphingobium sp. SCG-1]
MVGGEDRVLADDTWVNRVENESIGEAFSRLVGSGKEYAHAELNKQKLRAGIVAASATYIAILLVGALVIALAAVGALLVGLIITLSPALTPGGATAAVVVAALVIAGLLALLAKSRITQMTRDIKA